MEIELMIWQEQDKDVKMKSRKTTIHYISKIEINLPLVSLQLAVLKNHIRSLAHDIGQSLGVGAYLTQLEELK